MEETKQIMGHKWEPTDMFVLNGNEFALAINTLKNMVENPSVEVQNYLAQAKMYEMFQKHMQAGVVKGYVKEIYSEPNQKEVEQVNDTPTKAQEESIVKGN